MRVRVASCAGSMLVRVAADGNRFSLRSGLTKGSAPRSFERRLPARILSTSRRPDYSWGLGRSVMPAADVIDGELLPDGLGGGPRGYGFPALVPPPRVRSRLAAFGWRGVRGSFGF